MHYVQQIFHISIIPFPRFPSAFASNQSARFDPRRSSNRFRQAERVTRVHIPSRQWWLRLDRVFIRMKRTLKTHFDVVQNRYSPRLCRLNAELARTKINARHVARHGKRVSTRVFVVSPSFSTKSKWIFVLFVRIPMHRHPPELWNVFRDTLRWRRETTTKDWNAWNYRTCGAF